MVHDSGMNCTLLMLVHQLRTGDPHLRTDTDQDQLAMGTPGVSQFFRPSGLCKAVLSGAVGELWLGLPSNMAI